MIEINEQDIKFDYERLDKAFTGEFDSDSPSQILIVGQAIVSSIRELTAKLEEVRKELSVIG